jgi:hypothetical protein
MGDDGFRLRPELDREAAEKLDVLENYEQGGPLGFAAAARPTRLM